MASVEALGGVVGGIGEQRDALATDILGKADGIFQQMSTESAAAMIGVNDQVFQDGDASTEGGADGEEEIDHAPAAAVFTRDEDLAEGGIFKDGGEPGGLFRGVGLELGFLGEEEAEQLAEVGKVGWSGGLDFHGWAEDGRRSGIAQIEEVVERP